MGEILPDGSIQSGYGGYCQKCKQPVTVNIQGDEIGIRHNCESGEKQRLTLQECKARIAEELNEHDFESARRHHDWESLLDKVAELYASQSLPIQNPDKEHFDKKLLNELVWKLDREIWAHVENPNPSEPWTQSKAREESRKLIAEYIGDFDSFCLNLAPPIIQRNGCEIQCKECRTEIDKHQVPIREKPDWISVKERLPELLEDDESELVLCVGYKGTHPDYIQYELMRWVKLDKPDMKNYKGEWIFYGWSNRWWDRNPDLFQITHCAKLTTPKDYVEPIR
jgi:hypothetical protein